MKKVGTFACGRMKLAAVLSLVMPAALVSAAVESSAQSISSVSSETAGTAHYATSELRETAGIIHNTALVSPVTTAAVRDSLYFLDGASVPPHSEMTLPDLRLPILHHRTTTSMSPFKPMDTGMHRTPYPTPLPIDHIGGNIAFFSKNRYALGGGRVLHSYPSMGFSNAFTIEQTWAITDGITLSGGVYASDNLYHTNRFKDLGVSGRIKIALTDGVTLKGYGSYSLYNSAGGQAPVPPMMYPENRYGGSIEVKITDKFGLEGGAQRGFNMFTRQWETSYYVLPVFY
ncbi:MAG: hypothetical protein LBV18_06560 [Alistipes sp.]|nr:hypothetical protein [Alistipes sp.]